MERHYDPATHFSFLLKFGDDPTEYGFQEVSGLSTDIEVEPIVEGGAHVVHRLPEKSKHHSLTVKRGFVNAHSPLFLWCRDRIEAPTAQITPKTIVVSLRDEEGAKVATWAVKQAWPVKWDAGWQNATDADAAVESIEFAHAGIERVS
ncbi:MAG: phage tail protein [Pseudomonadota bacterium]